MRYAALVGALAGVLLTIGMPIALRATVAPGSQNALLLLWLWAFILLPAHRLSRFLGWAWEVNTDKSLFPPLAATILAVCVNSAIGYALGATLRSIANKYKRRRTDSSL